MEPKVKRTRRQVNLVLVPAGIVELVVPVLAAACQMARHLHVKMLSIPSFQWVSEKTI